MNAEWEKSEFGRNDNWVYWNQAKSYVWKESSPDTIRLSLSMYISLSLFEIPGSEFRPNLDFPGGSDGKASAYNAGDPGSIPGLGRSTEEGNGNPLQDYCLENPMDRGAW